MSPIARYSKTGSDASRRVLLIIALCLFVVALSLVIIQSVGPSSMKIKTYGTGYKDGFNSAKSQAAAMNPMANLPKTVLSGKITGISGNTLTVSVSGLMTDKNVDGIGTERKVTITNDTEISLMAPLAPEELAKKIRSFTEQSRSFKPGTPTPLPIPPSPTTNEKISISDLKVGDVIAIYGDGSDLTNESTINAKTITVSVRAS